MFRQRRNLPPRKHSRTIPMRLPILPTITAALLGANIAQARLFWQNYGSIVPANGCEESCTRNANQDYFVPRHCDSCRYGLFSPCKTSCTNSPACWWRHPLYPGYCSIYGPCYFHRRDQVHCCHCGCDPVRSGYGPWKKCCHGRHRFHGRPGCAAGWSGCATHGGYPLVLRSNGVLPNVEPADFEILGRLPAPGERLLASFDENGDQQTDLPGELLPRVPPAEPALPSLGRPASELLP